MNSIFAIIGPTGSGKTSVGVDLISSYNFSVINFDSCQMNIGLEKLKAMPIGYEYHYLYRIFDSRGGDILEWCYLAVEKVNEVLFEFRRPILIGGSGYYLNSLIKGVPNVPIVSKEVACYVDSLGYDEISSLLEKYDYESYLKFKDLRRMRRALGVYLSFGRVISFYYDDLIRFDLPKIRILALVPDRNILLERIKDRLVRDFDDMVFEVKNEYCDKFDLVIGVKEILRYLNKEIEKNECIDLIFYRTRQYAKKQNTYIRNCLVVEKYFNDLDSLKNYILSN